MFRLTAIGLTTSQSFASGAYVSLIASPIIAFGMHWSFSILLIRADSLSSGETGDVGRRTGMYFTVLAFGAIAGPPISGAINVATGSYTIVGIYAGMGSRSVLASPTLIYLVLVQVLWLSLPSRSCGSQDAFIWDDSGEHFDDQKTLMLTIYLMMLLPAFLLYVSSRTCEAMRAIQHSNCKRACISLLGISLRS